VTQGKNPKESVAVPRMILSSIALSGSNQRPKLNACRKIREIVFIPQKNKGLIMPNEMIDFQSRRISARNKSFNGSGRLQRDTLRAILHSKRLFAPINHADSAQA
jgi:hypothetical protein